MDEDTLKLEFKKQVSCLLDEISKLDTDLASVINDKYMILTDDHIEEFNNNISPYINEIIVQNSTIFKEDEIELFEDISLSNLWEKLSDDDKVIIFKYLQTIYLISNVYNRDNQSKEIHKMMKQIKSSRICVRKHARNYNFQINEQFEAGIILTGTEVKSLRTNTGSIKEAYITEKNKELWLSNCHIKKFFSSNEKKYNPLKDRKILVKKKEKNKLIGAIKKKGMSIVPILLYFNNRGIAKLSIGIGIGKKKYDKRRSIKDKEWSIKKQRIQKNRNI